MIVSLKSSTLHVSPPLWCETWSWSCVFVSGVLFLWMKSAVEQLTPQVQTPEHITPSNILTKVSYTQVLTAHTGPHYEGLKLVFTKLEGQAHTYMWNRKRLKWCNETLSNVGWFSLGGRMAHDVRVCVTLEVTQWSMARHWFPQGRWWSCDMDKL